MNSSKYGYCEITNLDNADVWSVAHVLVEVAALNEFGISGAGHAPVAGFFNFLSYRLCIVAFFSGQGL